jgi:hypothetical protein
MQFARWHFWNYSGTEHENSFHFLVRAEIAPALNRLGGVTLLLGWNIM